jgi:hypothetical protein
MSTADAALIALGERFERRSKTDVASRLSRTDQSRR